MFGFGIRNAFGTRMESQGPQLGPLLVALGAVLIVVGLLAWAGGLSWFGRLPGDLRLEGERSRLWVPVTSMIVVSVVLTLILHLLRRLF